MANKKWPNKKLTQEEAAKKVHDFLNGEYELVSEYEGSCSPCTILHKTCNKTFTISRFNNFFLRDQRCPYCKVEAPKRDLSNVQNFLKEIEKIPELKGQYEYVSGYVNGSTKCKLKHKECGTIFETLPKGFLNGRATRCPVCGRKKQTQHMRDYNDTYLEDCLKEAPDGDEYEWLEPYKGSNWLSVEILHKTCGTKFKVIPRDFRNAFSRCPRCSRISSAVEELIAGEIEKAGIEVSRHDRTVLDGKEIDILLPEYKIAIEVNGLYWHSDVWKDKNAHIDKKENARKKGYNLIHFYESQDPVDFVNFILIETLGKSSTGLNEDIKEDPYDILDDGSIFIDYKKIRYSSLEERDLALSKIEEKFPDSNIGMKLSLDIFQEDDNFLTRRGYQEVYSESPEEFYTDGHVMTKEETKSNKHKIYTCGYAIYELKRK